MEYTVANVKEENIWEEGVYQIEVTDPVVGGVDGISNKQAKQLANRTSYLKEKVDALTPANIFEEIKKIDGTDSGLDADKLDGLDSSAFARIEQVLVKRPLPKGDYTSVGFWRALDSGWYSYNHDSIQGLHNPTPYGFIYVLVEGSDYRVFWYRKNGIETYSLFFNGSQSSSSSAGWNLVSTTLTSGSYASTGVMRTENGDFSGRYIEAAQFKMSAPKEDAIFVPSNEIVFRQTHQDGQNFLRAVSVDKFKEVLKLFRLDQRNATAVFTVSQPKPIFDLALSDNFEVTLTGSGVLELHNGIRGQSGVIRINNASTGITGYASNIKWRTTPTNLQASEIFAYFVWQDGYISIGRV